MRFFFHADLHHRHLVGVVDVVVFRCHSKFPFDCNRRALGKSYAVNSFWHSYYQTVGPIYVWALAPELNIKRCLMYVLRWCLFVEFNRNISNFYVIYNTIRELISFQSLCILFWMKIWKAPFLLPTSAPIHPLKKVFINLMCNEQKKRKFHQKTTPTTEGGLRRFHNQFFCFVSITSLMEFC